MDEKPRRRWFRFSLRTLFALVTLFAFVAWWVVHSLSWTRQRDNFSVPYRASIGFYMPGDTRPRAPGLLWVFGEKGYDFVDVIIHAPPNPRNRRTPLTKERTAAEQACLETAAKLFPEAEIREYPLETYRTERGDP